MHRQLASVPAFVLTLTMIAHAEVQKDCSITSIPFAIPLTDFGPTDTYFGEAGGLYPDNSNTIPGPHLADGLAQAAAIVPLDGDGAHDPQNGRIVAVSIGLSNTAIEFSSWMAFSDRDGGRNPEVVLVDAARGGTSIDEMTDPMAFYWTTFVPTTLSRRHVTAKQVQVVWLKQTERFPDESQPFPFAAERFQGKLAEVVRILKTQFINVKICYLTTRVYAGYSTDGASPDPYCYETGFSVKWLIEQQILGDPSLEWDDATGAAVAPWLAWGPYLWANGTTQRNDGLSWACEDFRPDGRHPGFGVQDEFVNALETHFNTHPTAMPWYLDSGQTIASTRAHAVGYGSSADCGGDLGPPSIGYSGSPVLGGSITIQLKNTPPGVSADIVISRRPAITDLMENCIGRVDLSPGFVIRMDTLTTNGIGRANYLLQIPSAPALEGLPIFAQWFVQDPTAPNGSSVTRGLEIVLGTP